MNSEPSRFFENQKSHLRCNNPPGGKSSDIFNASGDESPFSSPQRRKKFHDVSKTNIFGAGDNADSNGNITKARSGSPLLNLDTKQRLFGSVENEKSPKRNATSDTYRSNVFDSPQNGSTQKNGHSIEQNNLTNGGEFVAKA